MNSEKKNIVGQIIKSFTIFCLKALLILFSIGVLIYITYLSYVWYTYDRHANKVKVIARIDRNKCNIEKYPVFISIKNNSEKIIESSSLRVEVTNVGHSAEFVNNWYY